MSIELAEKIKAMAKQQIDTAALVGTLEARVKTLELFYMPEQKGASPDMVRIEPDGKSPLFSAVVAEVATSKSQLKRLEVQTATEKRGRGRPKKV